MCSETALFAFEVDCAVAALRVLVIILARVAAPGAGPTSMHFAIGAEPRTVASVFRDVGLYLERCAGFWIGHRRTFHARSATPRRPSQLSMNVPDQAEIAIIGA